MAERPPGQVVLHPRHERGTHADLQSREAGVPNEGKLTQPIQEKQQTANEVRF